MRLAISFVGWPPRQPIATAGAYMSRSRGTLYRALARGELPIAGRRGRALDFPSRGPRSPGGVGSLSRARRRGVRVSDSMSPKTQPAPQPQPAPPAPQPAPVLTAKDLSRELGVSVETLRGWRYRGVGPAWFACGQSPRYLRAAVDAWAAAGGSKRESRRGKRGHDRAARSIVNGVLLCRGYGLDTVRSGTRCTTGCATPPGSPSNQRHADFRQDATAHN